MFAVNRANGRSPRTSELQHRIVSPTNIISSSLKRLIFLGLGAWHSSSLNNRNSFLNTQRIENVLYGFSQLIYTQMANTIYVISVCCQGRPFNITVIQVYAPTNNAKEAEAEWSVKTYKTF